MQFFIRTERLLFSLVHDSNHEGITCLVAPIAVNETAVGAAVAPGSAIPMTVFDIVSSATVSFSA